MMTVETLGVIVQAQNQQFNAQLDKITKSLENFGGTANKVSKQAGLFGTSMTLGAAAIGTAIAVITREVARFSIASTKMAMEAVESENLVKVSFGNFTNDIIDWSNKLQDTLGLNGFELRKNAALFYNISTSLGVTTDNAYKLSTGLTQLAGDLASFYNISTDEAITKLRAGLVGETEPLKQLGVIVDENTIKQTAYRVGIAQTGQELDNNQKILARYMTIMQQTSTAQGDLARTINSPANQARLLQSNIRYLSTTFGSLFIPVLNAVLPYLNAFVKLLTMGLRAIANLFGIAGVELTKTKDITQDNSKAMGGYSGATDKASNSTKKLKKELLGLAAFDEMNVLTSDKNTGAGGGGGVGGGSGFKLPDPPDFTKGIESKTDELVKKAQEGWKAFFEPIKFMWDEWAKPAFDGLFAVIKEVTGTQVDLTTIGRIIGVVILGAVGALVYALTGLIAMWKIVFDVGQFVFNSWKTGIQAVIKIFSGDVQGAVKLMIGYFFSLPTGVQTAFLNLYSIIYNFSLKAVTTFFNIRNAIVDTMFWAINKVMDKIDSFKYKISVFFTNIVESMKSSINKVIDGINTFLGTVRGIKIPVIAPNGIQIPNIPRLAQGGTVSKPSLIMAGEGGYNEAVLPLDRNTQWAKQVADLISKSGTTQGDQRIVINLGGETIYDKVIERINDKTMVSNLQLLNI